MWPLRVTPIHRVKNRSLRFSRTTSLVMKWCLLCEMIHSAGNTPHGCLTALIEQRKLSLIDDLCLTDADTLLKNRPNQNSLKFRGTSGQKAAKTSLQLNTTQCIMTTINYIKLHSQAI